MNEQQNAGESLESAQFTLDIAYSNKLFDVEIFLSNTATVVPSS